MDNKDNPCYKCQNRTENCHQTCREGKIFAIKTELERRKKVRYLIAYTHHATEGEKKRAINNLKWKGRLCKKPR